jgi:hypothetical protein
VSTEKPVVVGRRLPAEVLKPVIREYVKAASGGTGPPRR